MWHTSAAAAAVGARFAAQLRERLAVLRRDVDLAHASGAAAAHAELEPLIDGLGSLLAQGRGWLLHRSAGAPAALLPRRVYAEFLNASLLWDSQNALLCDFEGCWHFDLLDGVGVAFCVPFPILFQRRDGCQYWS